MREALRDCVGLAWGLRDLLPAPAEDVRPGLEPFRDKHPINNFHNRTRTVPISHAGAHLRIGTLGRLRRAVIVARHWIERPLGAGGDRAGADVGAIEEQLRATLRRSAAPAEALQRKGRRRGKDGFVLRCFR